MTPWLSGLDSSNRDALVTDTPSIPAMRTHCLARFLIDLPEDFEPMGDVELIYGLNKDYRKVKVETLLDLGSTALFERTTAARAAELASQYHSKAPSKSMLVFSRRVQERTVLIRSYDAPNMLKYFVSELYAVKGTAVVKVTSQTYAQDDPEAIESAAQSVVDKISFMLDPMKAGRGACLGPLLIDAGQDGEWFTVSFKSKRMPDVLIEFNSNSLLAESDGGLLARTSREKGRLEKAGFRSDTIRRGKIAIANRPGEELLIKGLDHGKVVRLFVSEPLLPKPATFAEPSFAINMKMGGQRGSPEYVDASMSEPDAVAMWDAIVKSIRLRPGAI